MSGAGNDFVVADNRAGGFPQDPATIAHICDRRFGVGADGVLLVEPSTDADFFMRYYNADGSEASMCGNGARCIARFYVDHCLPEEAARDEVRFETKAGPMRALISGELVRLQMTDPHEIRLRQTIKLRTGAREYHFADTGVPHTVFFSDNVAAENIPMHGPEVRHHAQFAPRGTNVNFVQRLGGDAIRIRTYERGVETETPACGTGVVASAILSHLVHSLNPPVKVTVQSGRVLEVDFARAGDAIRNVFLTGPAQYAFEGTVL